MILDEETKARVIPHTRRLYRYNEELLGCQRGFEAAVDSVMSNSAKIDLLMKAVRDEAVMSDIVGVAIRNNIYISDNDLLN